MKSPVNSLSEGAISSIFFPVRTFIQESVTLLNLTDFNNFAIAANLKVEEVFGNYLLEPYNEKTSDRLIIKFIK